MTTTLADATYTMGRTAAETRRLVAQARLYDRSTRRLFEDAGLTRGMKVLDVGSGSGRRGAAGRRPGRPRRGGGGGGLEPRGAGDGARAGPGRRSWTT